MRFYYNRDGYFTLIPKTHCMDEYRYYDWLFWGVEIARY